LKGLPRSFVWWSALLLTPLLVLLIYAYFSEWRRERLRDSRQTSSKRSVTDGSWTEFRSDEYGFRVLTPTTPKERIESRETPNGPVTIHAFISETGSVAFGVSFTRYPNDFDFEQADSATKEEIFEKVRNSMLRRNGKLIRESPISLQTRPGREIAVSVLGGQANMTTRIYLIGSETLSLSALIPKSYNDPRSVDRFFDSFQLIGTTTNKNTVAR
jgi:hypothetical protein